MTTKFIYKDITLEQANDYHSNGLIVVCDGDNWVLEIKKEK